MRWVMMITMMLISAPTYAGAVILGNRSGQEDLGWYMYLSILAAVGFIGAPVFTWAKGKTPTERK